MPSGVNRQVRPWSLEKKRGTERTGEIRFLFRPVIVGRDGRYVVYENSVICDCYSGLEWLPGPDRDISWQEARIWVNSLTTGGGGWRLPTLDQLRGLYKKNKKGDNLSPLFSHCLTDVWSCEEAQDAESAWGFNFLPGNQFRTCKTVSRRFRVMAVRQRKYHAFQQKTRASAD